MSSSRAETALLDGAARRRWQGWERPSISLLASGDIGRAASAVTPGSFSMVMATGIVSVALRLAGQPVLADVLLAVTAAGFLLIAGVTCWRAATQPQSLRLELTRPDRAFSAYAFTATWAVVFAAMARRPFASSRGRARAARAEHRLAAHEGQQLHETVPHQRGRAGNRKRCRFQAILTFLPAPAGARPADLTGPAWRAVLGAGHQGAGDGRLLTALVTSQDETGQQAGHSIVTLVVVGPSPADCLDVGEVFTLWRGYSVARGVITRRLFV